jgi:dTDP-glucose 4,6-dehydratase
VLDKLTYAARKESLDGLPADRVTFVQGDICDAELVDRLVADATWSSTSPPSRTTTTRCNDPSPFIQTNLVGTFHAAGGGPRHGVRYHHISTDEVYGDLELDDPTGSTSGPPTTRARPTPRPRRAPTCWCAPGCARSGCRPRSATAPTTTGRSSTSRSSSPPDHQRDRRRSAPKLYGAGLNVRDWIHVDDHNAAVLRIIEAGRIGETYLIGADGEENNKTVVETILRLMGHDPDAYDHVNDRPGHDLRYAIDSSKLRSELGWAPRYTVLRGRAWPPPSTGTAPTRLVASDEGRHRGQVREGRASDGRTGGAHHRDPRPAGHRPARARRRPRLVQGELAAGEDGGPRAA